MSPKKPGTGGTVAKIIVAALFLMVAPETEGSTVLVSLIIGLAFLAWAVLPYRRYRQEEADASAARVFAARRPGVGATVSKIAAAALFIVMGFDLGERSDLTVSLAISSKFTVEDIEALYDGMRKACAKWNVDIVGGDTTASLTGLCISITAIGEARPEDIVLHSGAQPNDLVCVSGNLGAAYMGLQLLEREKVIYNEQVSALQRQIGEAKAKGDSQRVTALNAQLSALSQPNFSGREYLLERQLKPEARGDIIATLRQAGIHPTSMMDISDGLSSELMHICKESGTGCRIYEERLPLDYQTAAMAEELNLNVSTCALNGGEDYELLFTVPLALNDAVQALEDIRVVGYITDADKGCALITRDGGEHVLKAQGWNPLKKD